MPSGNKTAYLNAVKSKIKPKKKKKRKLKKANPDKPAKVGGLSAGQMVQVGMMAKGAKKKDAAKMLVAGAATDYIIRGGKKIYNKVVDKVNKKRGY